MAKLGALKKGQQKSIYACMQGRSRGVLWVLQNPPVKERSTKMYKTRVMKSEGATFMITFN